MLQRHKCDYSGPNCGHRLRPRVSRRPIYQQTVAYGHFGRTDVDLPWEHTNKVEALTKAVKMASSAST